jgi:Fe-S cluster assembly protein SufD
VSNALPKLPVYLQNQLLYGKLPANLPGNHYAWLQTRREAALQRFLKCGLPSANDEDWRYTQLHGLEKQSVVAAQYSDAPAQAIEPLIENPCGRAIFVDGCLRRDLSTLDHLPHGLTVSTQRERLATTHVSATDYIPDPAGSDSWHDLNLALFQDGAWIEVAANCVIEQPLEVIFLSTIHAHAAAYHVRNMITLHEGAALKICKSKASNASHAIFSTHMNQITLAKGAKLERVVLSKHADTAFTFIHDDVHLAQDSIFKKTAINLGGKITRQKTTICLNGERAYGALGTLTYTDRDGTTDVLVEMRHHAPNTQSAQLARSLAGGKARAVFQGKITVAQIAQKTDAAQNHQGLLLSDTAEIDAKPSLEIYADDVKCSHGNTCGALDETSLFYLRSRGIARAQAEQLLQQAFVGELFEDMDEALRETLLQRITSVMKDGTV